MKTVTEELQELCDAAALSISEMAMWCDCFGSAMRQWLKEGVTPNPVRERHLRERLSQLRWAVQHDARLPVPTTVKQYDRMQYVQQVKDNALTEFPKSHSAKRGAQMLGEHTK